MPRFISALLLLFCCAASSAELLTRKVHLMGTSFEVSVDDPNRQKAIKETEAMIRIVETAENRISNWRPATELSKLNRQSTETRFQMTDEFCDLMRQLKDWTIRTDGAFDPAVGELIRTWGIQSEPRIASNEEIFEALQNTGMQNIEITESCEAIKRKPVTLDAGAFGKGYAIDLILRYASEKRITSLMIDFGGQVAVYSPKSSKSWKITVADPVNRHDATSISIPVSSGSLSTSGGSEKDRMINGRRFGHILDPRIGRPAKFQGSVTVWHPSALSADILSTALYVMGSEKGLKWADENGVAALFIEGTKITKSGKFNNLHF